MIHCICGEEIDPRRYILGYKFCLWCGEERAREVKHCIVPMNKSNYIPVTNKDTLKQLNPKENRSC